VRLLNVHVAVVVAAPAAMAVVKLQPPFTTWPVAEANTTPLVGSVLAMLPATERQMLNTSGAAVFSTQATLKFGSVCGGALALTSNSTSKLKLWLVPNKIGLQISTSP